MASSKALAYLCSLNVGSVQESGRVNLQGLLYGAHALQYPAGRKGGIHSAGGGHTDYYTISTRKIPVSYLLYQLYGHYSLKVHCTLRSTPEPVLLSP